jgi:hypothetical protein
MTARCLLLLLAPLAMAGDPQLTSSANELAAEAARGFGAPISTAAVAAAPPWPAEVRLRRELLGRGFHRTLVATLEAPAPAGGAPRCRVALLQPLPSGLFADPYQLADLRRGMPGAAFEVAGPLDLEL